MSTSQIGAQRGFYAKARILQDTKLRHGRWRENQQGQECIIPYSAIDVSQRCDTLDTQPPTDQAVLKEDLQHLRRQGGTHRWLDAETGS